MRTSAGEPVPDYVQALLDTASYLNDEDRTGLVRAWEMGAAAHEGQMRKSGEPYITHPVAVAGVLAELGLDEAKLRADMQSDRVSSHIATSFELADHMSLMGTPSFIAGDEAVFGAMSLGGRVGIEIARARVHRAQCSDHRA